MNRLRYRDITELIDAAPLTWLPALFVYIAECCLRYRVFRVGSARTILEHVEAYTKPKAIARRRKR